MTGTARTGDEYEPLAPRGRPPRPSPSWAAVGCFLILAFGAVTLARGLLTPVTLALLLFFVFSPVCRIFSHVGIPQGVTAAIITLGLFVGSAVATTILAVPLSSALQNAPQIFRALDEKMTALRGSVAKIQDAAAQLQSLGQNAVPQGTTVVAADNTGVLTGIALTTPSVLGQFIFTLVLLFFGLASRDVLYMRTVQSFSSFTDKQSALAAMHEIERSLGHYLGTITLINAGLGIAIGLAMWAWGMPAPALFGAAGFAFNFVPYIGAIGGVILSTLVALVTMDGVLAAALVGLTYLALTSFEGQFVTPYFLSQRLRLNTVVVFIAVALFAWLWSVVGMIVAVPLLVVLHVICTSIPGMRGLGRFLSGDVEAIDERIEDAVEAGPARTAPPTST